MTTGDYVSIAANLKLALREEPGNPNAHMYNCGVYTSIRMLADHFARWDRNFDRAKFLETAGYNG